MGKTLIIQQIKDCIKIVADLPWRTEGYQLGVLHIPTGHTHRVTYHRGYGTCATTFVTTNGNLFYLVSCLREGTTFVPCQMLVESLL